MRNIKFKTTGSHEYLAESLTRGQNTGNAYYSEGRLSMPDGDRIYWKDIAHTESIGTKQYWKRLVDGDPDMPLAWYGKAIAELQAERFSVALPLLVKISKSKLDNASVLNSVAWTLATSSEIKIRNPSASLVAAKRACELSENDNAMYLDTLAAAWAANGNFEQARKTQALAIEKLDAYDSDEKNATRKFLKQEFGVWGLEEGYKLHRQEFQEREELFSRGKAYIEE
jgi:tetratricopeptide (TPR) repeat protein